MAHSPKHTRRTAAQDLAAVSRETRSVKLNEGGELAQAGPDALLSQLFQRRSTPPAMLAQYAMPVGRAEGSPEEGETSTAAKMLREMPRKGKKDEDPTDEEFAAASRPAFLTPKSGIGRKISTKPGELEAAALQGVSETPYNVLGAPVDLATMAMRPFGYDVKAPIGGSEWFKQQASRVGVRQEPPSGAAARALYEIGQLGSSAVNPTAPVRGAVKAAEKTGEAAQQLARDFQQYNRQLSVPGASYVTRSTNPQFIPNKISEGTLERVAPVSIAGRRPAEQLEELRNTFGTVLETGEGLEPRAMAHVMRAKNQLEQETALDSWINTTLRKYITRDMATEGDPVRKLADEGITAKAYEASPETIQTAQRKRQEYGFPVEGSAKTEEGKAWEAVSDVSFRSTPADFFTSQATEPSILQANPWLLRVDPNTPITRAGTRMVGEPQDTFQHIVDVLRTDLQEGRLRPEAMNKLSMADAVKRAHAYNAEIAKRQAQARVAAMADRPVYKTYDNGYKWIELTKPGDFASESDAMGHSVRGYEPIKGSSDWVQQSGDSGIPAYGVGGWESIKQGKAKVFSLRDPQGNPHATAEVEIRPASVTDWIAYGGDDYQNAVNRLMQEFPSIRNNTTLFSQKLKESPEYLEFARNNQQQIVRQIKGKQNDPVAPKYEEFGQDFLRSGKWDRVNDADKVGLVDTPQGLMTKKELIGLFESLPDNVKQSPFVQERIDWLKRGSSPSYDFYDAYLYARDTLGNR